MGYVGKVLIGSNTYPIGSTLYGTCSTAANEMDKIVTCNDFDQLITGATIHVKFTNENTANTPTMNVNSTGTKLIANLTKWQAGATLAFTYDGTNWCANGSVDDTKLDKPAVAGTSGQVLTSDGNGGQSWEDPTGGGEGGRSVFYGTCTAVSYSKDKYVSCPEFTANDLVTGTIIVVRFTLANTATSQLRMDVNSTGYKPLCITPGASISGGGIVDIEPGIYMFIYDGANWTRINPTTRTLTGTAFGSTYPITSGAVYSEVSRLDQRIDNLKGLKYYDVSHMIHDQFITDYDDPTDPTFRFVVRFYLVAENGKLFILNNHQQQMIDLVTGLSDMRFNVIAYDSNNNALQDPLVWEMDIDWGYVPPYSGSSYGDVIAPGYGIVSVSTEMWCDYVCMLDSQTAASIDHVVVSVTYPSNSGVSAYDPNQTMTVDLSDHSWQNVKILNVGIKFDRGYWFSQDDIHLTGWHIPEPISVVPQIWANDNVNAIISGGYSFLPENSNNNWWECMSNCGNVPSVEIGNNTILVRCDGTYYITNGYFAQEFPLFLPAAGVSF